MWVFGVACRSKGGVVSSPEYHLRNVFVGSLDRRGWAEIEEIVVVMCMVVGYERCEVGVAIDVEDSDWIE